MSNHGTRWQTSVLTFGPVGRVVCTLLLLAPPLWLLQTAGPFGIVFALVWCTAVLPRALRDIWRRAPLPETDLSRLATELARDAERAGREPRTHEAFGDTPPPGRW